MKTKYLLIGGGLALLGIAYYKYNQKKKNGTLIVLSGDNTSPDVTTTENPKLAGIIDTISYFTKQLFGQKQTNQNIPITKTT